MTVYCASSPVSPIEARLSILTSAFAIAPSTTSFARARRLTSAKRRARNRRRICCRYTGVRSGMDFFARNYAFADGDPPVVIGEIGVNHNGDPALARRLVDVAVAAGVH